MKAKSSSGLNKWYHNVAQQYSINKTIQLNKHTGTQIAFLWRYEGKGRNKYRNICMSFLVTISVSRPLQMEVIKKKNQILRNNCLSPKVRCSDTPPPAVAGGHFAPSSSVALTCSSSLLLLLFQVWDQGLRKVFCLFASTHLSFPTLTRPTL